MGRRLRSGYTTGACAAAAAKGAVQLLLGRPVQQVTLQLPWEAAEAREVAFSLVDARCEGGGASCGVVKDGGDDPDVTHGIEIRARVEWGEEPLLGPDGDPSAPLLRVCEGSGGTVAVLLEGGRGVGRVTKPGLSVAVGEPAINPVPRGMIDAAVRQGLEEAGHRGGANLRVTVSVPRGEEVARKTLNGRLGILGGLSILGTTGIVMPMSADAWRATIDSGLDVARATGLQRVVLSHGRSSEAAAQALSPDLPPEAFVLMGDHVGYAVDAAASRGLAVTIAGQFAKFCKVASGSFETHVKDSSLDLGLLSRLLGQAGFSPSEVEAALRANTAREVFQRLLQEGDRGVFPALTGQVVERVSGRARGRVPVEAVLFGYDKRLLSRVAVGARGSAGRSPLGRERLP